MPRHGRRPHALLLFLMLSCAPSSLAWADDTVALRRDLQVLRQQLATLTESYEQRLKVLGDRLEQLEHGPTPPVPAAPETMPPGTGALTAGETPPTAEAPTLADLARPASLSR
jgi:hypothetical protein